MKKLQAFAIGLGMTALSIAVLFFLVRRFAPDSVKDAFRV
jgi:hypothetical protein